MIDTVRDLLARVQAAIAFARALPKLIAPALPALKYFASHASYIGGVAMAVVLFSTGQPGPAWAALIAALSGFGINLHPAAQARPR